MGGFDIFISVIDENQNWSTPINLGYPLNTTGDDIFYTTTVDGLTGFMTSDRKGSVGEKDIYEIHNDYLGVKNIAVLQGRIKTVNDVNLPEDVSILVKCLNCGNPVDKKIIPRLRDGVFFSSLEPCRDYELVYSRGEKEFHTDRFSTNCDKSYEEVYREILLDVDNMTVIEPKDTIAVVQTDPVRVQEFENLTFKHTFSYNVNKLNIRKGQLKEFINDLEDQVKDGRTKIVVTINSSASKVPTKTFESNEKLAQLRAENVKYDLEYMLDKNPELKNNVILLISNVSVGGPEYSGDSKNKSKYEPFQYVELTTE